MKRTLFQRAVCLLLSVMFLFGIGSTSVAATSGNSGTNRDTASSLDEMQKLVGVLTYEEYLEAYGSLGVDGLDTITLDMSAVLAGSSATLVSQSQECLDSLAQYPEKWVSFGDNLDSSYYLPAVGTTTWSFNVPEGAAGLYYIKIEYFTCYTSESSSSSIEREMLIDGSAAFDESRYVTLGKYWSSWSEDNVTVETFDATGEDDSYTVTYDTLDEGYCKIVRSVVDGVATVTTYTIFQDIVGNSMSAEAEQLCDWHTYYLQDTTGYYTEYFQFYFLNGDHQLSLVAERDPVIVKSIELVPIDDTGSSVPTYAELLQYYQDMGYTSADASKDSNFTVLQAEYATYVSDSSVYPTNDNTSAVTYPTTPKAQLYNVIGENSYNTVGQWAAYSFKVNESGLYKLSMRYLQSALQGMYICRTLKLAGGSYGLEDGTPTVPFQEAYDLQFNYDKKWQSTYLGDSNGNVFELYFEEGVEYTLYLECSLGSLKELLQRVENTLDTINEGYLKILQLTGSDPDDYKDYKFEQRIPEVLVDLLQESIALMEVKAELEELCGTSGSHTATLETIAILFDTMGAENGEDIAKNLSNLKSYLGTLGTWINNSKNGTLIMDSITVCPADAAEEGLQTAKAGFFKSIWHEICSFIYSFFTDYDNMGLTVEPDEDAVSVNVWIATGRDQSQIWRSLIDAQGGFTDSTGYAVTLKLVTGGTLLPSILSGKGPDVYIGLGSADVINYAIRGAVIGMSGNDGALTDEQNETFTTIYYTYTYTDTNADGSTTTRKEVTTEYRGEDNLTYVSNDFNGTVDGNYVEAAMNTVTLRGVTYGIPQTMGFAMMFYRMDVLAKLGEEVPDTWSALLDLLPKLQANNMNVGLAYGSAIDIMLYQMGGNMWKFTDDAELAGAQIGLDTDVALESFRFVCRLYTDYSFPVSYDAANRFRTGEMPIVIGDYAGVYNQLVVYATELDGLWEFCPLPGYENEDGTVNYDSIAGVAATVMLTGCEDVIQQAWAFVQWQTSASVQSKYGNRMVALIGPSAKYEAANINAINNLSWTASEKAAILNQIENLSSVVNYPGSYIIGRYTKFAFLAAVNDGADPIDSISGYIDTINGEITRKREEFGLICVDSAGNVVN